MKCRNCGSKADVAFCDLGAMPLANAYLRSEDLDKPETTYPLRPVICPECRLVQLPELAAPDEIFRDYAYFSGQSESWREHCDEYAMKVLANGWSIRSVLEIASNDGTLLDVFKRRGCRALGVEPARNVAWHAQTYTGVPTIPEFFGIRLAERLKASGYQPDLIVANNVLAHVPDLDDFLRGIELLITDETVVTFEFPHLARLIESDSWDTIYHEHFSYFGFITAQRVLERRNLRVFDVEELDVHGGSLRLYACRYSSPTHETNIRVPQMSRWESDHGYWDVETLAAFASRPSEVKCRALGVLSALREAGVRIAGYGAPAKGSTALNWFGFGPETIEFVVDSTSAKQGRFMPGSRIPILAPEALQERKPDAVWILAPNWESEMRAKIGRDCDWDPIVLCRPWLTSSVAQS